jgi:hypothetical protein
MQATWERRIDMKKTIMLLFLIGAAALITTGCSSFETNRAGNPVNVKMDVNVKPDIELGKEMVSGKASVNSLFGIFTWGVENEAVGVNYGESNSPSIFGDSNAVARNGAAYDACTKSKADLLLAPRYDITTKDYFVFKKIDCQVKGYPGILKSIEIIK